jgi:hypothetical protein
MRQPATGITQNLGNRNRKKDRTAVRFSSVLWIFSVHRTEPANTTESAFAIVSDDRDQADMPRVFADIGVTRAKVPNVVIEGAGLVLK